MALCGCGSGDGYECVLELLCEAENHTTEGFYRDKWFEFGAKVIDSWNLTEHGTGIGFGWLTDDGKLLLQFLRDFGNEGNNLCEGTGHPEWSVEFSWTLEGNEKDSYSSWVEKVSK